MKLETPPQPILIMTRKMIVMTWLLLIGTTHVASIPAKSNIRRDSLYLTPIMNDGWATAARELSKVSYLPLEPSSEPTPESYSGFITTDQTIGDHLFFWYFPATQNRLAAPLFIYLSGRPGSTSMQAELWENGPIAVEVDTDGEVRLTRRDIDWSSHFSIVYIDSPVGVGYSHSNRGLGDRQFNSEDVSMALYDFLIQFYKIYTETQYLPLYIGGEAYAAKDAIALAHLIHKNNKMLYRPIPLKGLYLMAPFIDPIKQQQEQIAMMKIMGFIDYQTKYEYNSKLNDLNYKMQEMGPRGNIPMDRILQPQLAPFADRAENWEHGRLFLENWQTNETVDFVAIESAMMKIRDNLHVGSGLNFQAYDKTFASFHYGSNFFQSSARELGELLDEQYKVLVISGNKDLYITFFGHFKTLSSVPWAKEGRIDDISKDWIERNQRVASFIHADNLCFLTLDNVGHQIARDAPETTLKIMSEFVETGCVVVSEEENGPVPGTSSIH